MIDDYIIIIEKYDWSGYPNILPADVNFFSKFPPALIDEIDVLDYLIEHSKCGYSFDDSDNNSYKNNFFFTASDLTLKLSGIKNNNYLVTFFELQTNNALIKFKYSLRDLNNNIIYQGFINPESIKEPFTQDDLQSTEIIDVQVLGLEKEFKAYYQANQLKNPYPPDGNFNPDTDIDWKGNTLPNITWRGWYASGGFHDLGPPNMLPLLDILQQNFVSSLVQWSLEPGLEQWWVCRNTFFGFSQNPGLPFIMVGQSYDRVHYAQENLFGWLQRMCNAMGWIFFHFADTFYIKNRSALPINNVDLDANKFIEWEISKTGYSITYQTIVLANGNIDTRDLNNHPLGMGGTRTHVISNQPNVDEENWWTSITPGTFTYFVYNQNFNIGYKYQWLDADGDSYSWNVTTLAVLTNPITHGHYNGYSNARYYADKTTLIGIDCGDSKDKWTGVRTVDGKQFDWEENISPPPAADEIVFKSNYGGMLIQIHAGQITMTYKEYIKSYSQLKNNYLKYFQKNGVRNIKVKYSGILINPLSCYNIINNPELAGKWDVNNLTFDIDKEITELDLQYKENQI